ncbi:EAL and GGDEF domain-containing protein [Defluviitalea raffinosedens]|uniref:sensor domain-containing protein n=1 Tax=Defluviitalea raffinosedens TaxID=1450156 RepID=UPI0019567CAE|nr:diguanylate cyclase (GGDEF)-like protein/PAS domain S-box-containing protein [Defluviitalea raffinosedens]
MNRYHKTKKELIQDIEAMEKEIEKLKKTHENLQTLFNTAPIGLSIVNEEGLYEYVNEFYCKLYGYTPEELIGKHFSMVIPSENKAALIEQHKAFMMNRITTTNEFKVINKKQEQFTVIVTSVYFTDSNALPKKASYVVDITEQKKIEEIFRYQAYHDSLTGLPNRKYFMESLNAAREKCSKCNHMLAVMFLDLDRFKNINDVLGHSAGDLLIQSVAERLRKSLDETYVLSRFGGDEFVILLPEVYYIDIIIKTAEKIIKLFELPFIIHGKELFITTSMGIGIYPYDGTDSETLIKNADTAMYKAKTHSRGNYQLYSSAINLSAFSSLALENDLYHALEKNQLVLYYQPQVNICTGEIVGAEALIRWQHPELGLLNPDQFIPLAEDNGLIIPIGKWVLETACMQNRKWQDFGYSPIKIAVNLSALQIQQNDFVDTVTNILRTSRLNPSDLELEITESIVMKSDIEDLIKLNQLKQLGIKFSMDDFGMGYSSLNNLKNLNLHHLKIDRSFLYDIDLNSNNCAIFTAILFLANSLNLNIVPEGIETQNQLDFLKKILNFARSTLQLKINAQLQTQSKPQITTENLCPKVQGFLFSPPVPADQFEELLKKGKFEIL